MKRLIIPIVLLISIGCANSPDGKQVGGWLQNACDALGKSETPQPESEPVMMRSSSYRNYCDVASCNECNVGGSLTIVDENGRPIVIPECPEDSGFLCCDSNLENCAALGGGGDPNDGCPGGDVLWCDYYEQDGAGGADCWDEFGQG